MIRLYIAGPYNGLNVMEVLHNIRNGILAAHYAAKEGFAPFCPWLDFQLVLKMDMPIEMLRAISMAWLEASSAVWIIGDWERSRGTLAEIQRAEQLGIPVFYKLADLLAWRDAIENTEMDNHSRSPCSNCDG